VDKLIKSMRATAHELFRAARDPALLVWGLYLLAVPVYIFKSGIPQPGDYLVFVLAPMLLGRRRPLPATVPARNALLVFLLHMTLINLLWSLALGSWSFKGKEGFLMPPVFYIYNVIMFFNVLALYQKYRDRFLWFTAKLIIISLGVQAFVALFHVSASLRAAALFNNANQLGAFAVLSASLLLMFHRSKHISTLEVTFGVLATVYLCLMSASRGALVGIGLLAVCGAFVRIRTILLVGGALVVMLLVGGPMLDALHRTTSRVKNDTNMTVFEERGYDRIMNNPWYVVIGSGEGDYDRFEDSTAIHHHEIHSSFGTLIFCYGIAGLILFGVFVYFVLRGSGFRTWLLVAPSFVYGMTHQALRTTMFWVLLAVVLAIHCERKASRERERAKRPTALKLTRAAA